MYKLQITHETDAGKMIDLYYVSSSMDKIVELINVREPENWWITPYDEDDREDDLANPDVQFLDK